MKAELLPRVLHRQRHKQDSCPESTITKPQAGLKGMKAELLPRVMHRQRHKKDSCPESTITKPQAGLLPRVCTNRHKQDSCPESAQTGTNKTLAQHKQRYTSVTYTQAHHFVYSPTVGIAVARLHPVSYLIQDTVTCSSTWTL